MWYMFLLLLQGAARLVLIRAAEAVRHTVLQGLTVPALTAPVPVHVLPAPVLVRVPVPAAEERAAP